MRTYEELIERCAKDLEFRRHVYEDLVALDQIEGSPHASMSSFAVICSWVDLMRASG